MTTGNFGNLSIGKRGLRGISIPVCVSGIVEIPDISLRQEVLFWPHTASHATFITQNMSENRMKLLSVA